MKIKVEYSESIQVAEGLWRKIGIELDDEKDEFMPDQLHRDAKYFVQRWHKEAAAPISPFPFDTTTTVTQMEPQKSAIQRTIDAMNQCSEIKVLQSFEKLAKSNAALHEVYLIKLEELSK